MANYDIIGISGCGGSGADAVRDLLFGCSELQVYEKGESQILHYADGILDLKHYLVECRDKIASNAALKRYKKSLYDYRSFSVPSDIIKEYRKISLKYMDALILCKWKGFSAFDPKDVEGGTDKWIVNKSMGLCRKIGKLFGVELAFPPSKERYFSILPEERFNDITGKYLDQYFHLLGFHEKKPVVLEQFFVFSHPTLGFEFLKSAKVILVQRDPRDVYANCRFTIKTAKSKNMGRFMPTGNVEDFIKYYNALHTGIEKDPRVFTVQFENLIYEYEQTVQDIVAFLGIQRTPEFGKKFDPSFSIKNTGIYKSFPEIAEDVKKIEKRLPQFLNSYVD